MYEKYKNVARLKLGAHFSL